MVALITKKTFVTAADAIFTVADIDSQVIGSSINANQTVRIQDKGNLASGTLVDANIDRIELFGALADYDFTVDAVLGFQIKAGGNVVANIANQNQNMVIAFSDGNATLVQADNNIFTLTANSVPTTVNTSGTVAGNTLTASIGSASTVTYDTDGTAVTPTSSGGISKSFVTGGDTTGGSAATPTTTAIGGTPAIFTVADKDVKVKGGDLGNEVVRIQAGVTGVVVDANIERIELSAALATYKFVAVNAPTTLGLQIQNTDGSIVATIPSINQAVKIAFTDGSATLAQTGATAFTLNTVALAVGATGAATAPDLSSNALVTTVGERSALGLHITNATVNIADAFSTYGATSGTSGTAATVVATGMDNATKVSVLATNVSQIATNGITGSINLTGEEFTTLSAKLDATTTLTVNADSGTARTATVLAAMNTKSTPNVDANIVTTVTGLAVDIATVTDAMGTGEGKINMTGLTTLEPSDAISANTFDNTAFTQASVQITLANVASNALTVATGTVASGNTLKVIGSALDATNALTFTGFSEEDGKYSVVGGAGSDAITGSANSDTIDGGAGSDTITAGAGSDNITGGADNDTIIMATNLAGAGAGSDTVDGGAGIDTLTMTGNTIDTQLNGVTNVEIITLGDAATTITTIDGLVASGANLKVDG
ncbi:MAG: hypothetical protein PHQ03_08370, partial [Methylococcales bacterium]|nr:hypothetical protein [Methylococcales bacterium]